MSSLARLTIIFSLLIISACSGIQVSHDFEQGFDFSNLKNFAWDANEEDQWGVAASNELVDPSQMFLDFEELGLTESICSSTGL